MSTILPLFWHLSSTSKDERLVASAKLVDSLTQFQDQHTANGIQTDSDSEENAQDEFEKHNATDVSYSIRRLIRGLASPRESSRLGFVVVLTELLSRLDTLTAEQVLEMMIAASETKGSMSGQEERDMYFARLFGMTSLVRSGLLFRSSGLSYRPEQTISTKECFHKVINELVELSGKKTWLRESCWWSIGLALEALQTSSVSWKAEASSTTLTKLFSGSWTPEKIALALKLRPLYSDEVWTPILSTKFKGNELLTAKNLPAIVAILKEEEASDEGDSAHASSSTWTPQLHFVWSIILDHFYPPPSAPNTKVPPMPFRDFFRQVVDEVFFANNASTDRKYRGFQIFQKALSRVPENEVAMLFTTNLMRCWINNLSVNDRYLHRMTLQLAKDTQKLVEQKPNSAFPIVMALMGTNGNQQFDRLTKTNTISSILAAMNEEGIQKYRDYLLQQFAEKEDEESAETLNRRRAWAIEQLSMLIRNGSIPKTEEMVQSILEFLTLHGLFTVRKKTEKGPFKTGPPIKPALSDELHDQCLARLFACLADLATQASRSSTSGPKDSEPQQEAVGTLWIPRIVKLVGDLLEDPKHYIPLVELEDEERSSCKAAIKLMNEVLLKAPDTRRSVAKGAELLVAGTILQAFVREDRETQWEVLEECIETTNKLISTFTPSKKQKKSAPKEEETSPAVDLLVDVIIGYMERGSAYLRTVGTKAFALLCDELEESTLDLILAQLEQRSQGEAEDEEEEEEEAEDVEMASGDDAEVDSDSSSSESEEDAEEEDVNDDENSELRDKIEEALRINGVERASDSGSDSEEEEELLDDDQMMQFDEKLAEVFRMRRGEKLGKGVDAQRDATHFKNRVVDLLEAFTRHHPTSPYLINLPVPIVRAILACGKDEKQYSDKLTGLLRSRVAKVKDFPKSVNTARAKADLQTLHELGRKLHSADQLATINACSLYLSRILVHEGFAADAAQVYRDSLKDFATRKASQLNPSFLKEVCRRLPELAWTITQDFLDATEGAINAYRKVHTFDFIATFVTQPYTSERIDALKNLTPSISAKLVAMVESACEGQDTKTLNAQQLKEVTKASQSIARFCRKHLPADSLSKTWNVAKLAETQEKLNNSERFKQSGVNAAWKTLLNIFDSSTQSKSSKKESKKAVPLGNEGQPKETAVSKAGEKRKKKTQDAEEEAVTGAAEQGEDQPSRKPKRKKIKHKKTATS